MHGLSQLAKFFVAKFFLAKFFVAKFFLAKLFLAKFSAKLFLGFFAHAADSVTAR
jgi:hypothetical protein